MSDPLRLRPLGEHAALVRNRLTAITGAELVDDPDRAELVVMTPEDLAEMIEDAEATAAYQREPGAGVARASRPFAAPARRTRRDRGRLSVADRERTTQRHHGDAEKDRRRPRHRPRRFDLISLNNWRCRGTQERDGVAHIGEAGEPVQLKPATHIAWG